MPHDIGTQMTASQKQAGIHCLTKFPNMSLDTRCGLAQARLMSANQGCMAQNISTV